jgi:hypothetical protein
MEDGVVDVVVVVRLLGDEALDGDNVTVDNAVVESVVGGRVIEGAVVVIEETRVVDAEVGVYLIPSPSSKSVGKHIG